MIRKAVLLLIALEATVAIIIGFINQNGLGLQPQVASLVVITKQGSTSAVDKYRFLATDTGDDVAGAEFEVKSPYNSKTKVPLPWTANSDSPWLSVSPSSGVTPGDLTLSVERSLLASGNQKGTITVMVSNELATQVEVSADCKDSEGETPCGTGLASLPPAPQPNPTPSSNPNPPTPPPTSASYARAAAISKANTNPGPYAKSICGVSAKDFSFSFAAYSTRLCVNID